MVEYLIQCVNLEHSHRHVVSAMVRKLVGDHYEDKVTTMTVSSIRSQLAAGDVFNTYSRSTDAVAAVEPFTCDVFGCTVETIRSSPDAVEDNNLDNMECPSR